MAVPWLNVVDTLLDLGGLALGRSARRGAGDPDSPALPSTTLGHLETRLTGVVVAALKEAFDRDASRLELERDQLERERLQAERMLALELRRQTADREIGRLRLLAGVAVGSLVATLLLSSRLVDGPLAARVMLGLGWLLLLVALALSFAAQSAVSRAVGRIDAPSSASAQHDDLTGGVPAALVPWLIVSGLGVIGFAVLMG